MKNDPLTHRFKHETRELDNDPLDWWEGPERNPPVAQSVLLVLLILAVFAIVFWWAPR